MRKKTAISLVPDMAMLVCLLGGLAYPLTGNTAHEMLGLVFFALCVIHIRGLLYKLLGLTSFEYWDFDTATWRYFAGYAAVLGVCVAVTRGYLRLTRPRHENTETRP